jgi:EAL domain-containing protein (putative c-di-GMP-specific phosphodiesterase class I)
MAARRPGRASIFTGATLRRRPAPLHADPSTALTALGGVTYVWDLSSDGLTFGPNAFAVLGLEPGELPTTGAAFRDLIEPGGGAPRDGALAPGESFERRYTLRLSANRAIVVQDSGRCVAGTDERPGFVRGCLRADPEAQDRDLLPRRTHERSEFLGWLQNDIADALRFAHGVTVIVCEIGEDGPDIGEVMRRTRSMMRSRDQVVPLSTTRFALALPSCAATDAPHALNKLGALLSADRSHIRLAGACAPDHALDACRLLALAERTLAQTQPGSMQALYEPMIAEPRSAPAEPFDMIRALNERHLGLAPRTIVDAHHLTPALSRMETTILGVTVECLPPDTATALLVDARRLELAGDALAAAPDARIVLPIGLATLRDREWLSVLAAHLGARPGIASRMIVALPEAVLVEKTKVLGRLDAMKALGIGLSLDGFGSGYATCARLRSLPIDLVTIDGAFIQNLGRSTGDRLFVRTLVDIAQRLGIATLAEWVDDTRSTDMLREWGIDYLQGNLFEAGKATPAAVPMKPALRRA